MSDSQDCFLCSKPATGTCPDCALVHYCSDSHLRSHKPFGDCLPFRVGFVEGVGRVVLAVRDIKAGDVVITEHPIVKGPGNKTPPSCLQCLRQWEGETTCTKCGWPVCNEKCQAGDIHEIECNILSKCPKEKVPDFSKHHRNAHSPNYAAIFPLRLAILSRSSSDVKERMDLLMDHKEEITTDPDFDDLWKFPVLNFLTGEINSEYSYEEILRSIGLFCTNAVSMINCNGRWIFPTFSFLSHSCVSNSRFFVHPGDLAVVRAETDIKAGAEVTISYTDSFPGNVVRRESIKDLWYFRCTCERCQDVTELGTNLSAVRCRVCMKNEKSEAMSYMLPKDSSDLKADWHCSSCENIIKHQTIVMLIKGLKIKVKENYGDLAGLSDLLLHLQEFLHPNHFLILELKQRWVKLAAKLGKSDQHSLETILNYIGEITKINKKIDPGLTLTLGENLKLLNKAMLNLGKIRMEAGDINQKEFMNIALGAATNIKFAKKCFEKSYDV